MSRRVDLSSWGRTRRGYGAVSVALLFAATLLACGTSESESGTDEAAASDVVADIPTMGSSPDVTTTPGPDDARVEDASDALDSNGERDTAVPLDDVDEANDDPDALVEDDADGADADGADAVDADADEGCPSVGCACLEDVDCESGYCVQTTASGSVCAELCGGTCSLEDWECRLLENTGGDVVELCVPVTIPYCNRCETGLDCGSLRAGCVSLLDGAYCVPPCDLATPLCPAGSSCQRQTVDGEVGTFCIPDAGQCTPCIDADGDLHGAGDACVAADCDETDDATYAGAPELCDGRDNDCDEEVDEGFDLQTSLDHCGACDVSCAFAGGIAECVDGTCHLVGCTVGRVDCDGDASNGCETPLGGLSACEACNPGIALGAPCGTCESGTWQCSGTEVRCVGDEGDAAWNACGGCAVLPNTPGLDCGACEARWICDGRDAVRCEGDPTDSDGDGVCDPDDRCPGSDDAIDSNGNGVPDACEAPCPPGRYGADCAGICNCVNGECNDGRRGTGACSCEPRWAGAACDACANGFFGADCAPCRNCGPNGTCDDGVDGDGGCVCDAGFSGAGCDACATGLYGEACTGVCACGPGTCDDGIDGSGRCTCPSGRYGASCGGTCACVAGICNDGARGDGSCTCPSGRYGPTCAGICDCERGTCNDGAAGDGTCACPDGFTGARCDRCEPGRYGLDCQGICACGGGDCNDGLGGNGACECPPGFTGARCDACEPGRFGPDCRPCPLCAEGTECDDGIDGSGRCACVPRALDDATCDNVDDDCDGRLDEDFESLPFGCCLSCFVGGQSGVYQEFDTEVRCINGRPQCVPRPGARCNVGEGCF